MKIKSTLLLSLMLYAGATYAQSADRQVLGSSGGSYSGASIQADFTAGETATASGASGSFLVNQGFQQNPANTLAIKEQGLLVNYALFPNPAQEIVTLGLITKEGLDLKISLTNATGQNIFTDPKAEKISTNYKREISLKALASGIYFLNLFDNNNGLLQSIRFIKQ
ncbi:MAG: T9SS type A sorting domain-containing protein [Chitinophagaceae bacterium]|nr:T9SS type A sorting domain-containing protein [Chitinophagaceae bacterium]